MSCIVRVYSSQFVTRFLVKFIYTLLLSLSRSSSNMDFVRFTLTYTADSMAATCPFGPVDDMINHFKATTSKFYTCITY